MDGDVKSAIWVIGEWLVSSIPASDLDRLMDCMNTYRLETDRKSDIADELAMAMGYEAFN